MTEKEIRRRAFDAVTKSIAELAKRGSTFSNLREIEFANTFRQRMAEEIARIKAELKSEPEKE